MDTLHDASKWLESVSPHARLRKALGGAAGWLRVFAAIQVVAGLLVVLGAGDTPWRVVGAIVAVGAFPAVVVSYVFDWLRAAVVCFDAALFDVYQRSGTDAR